MDLGASTVLVYVRGEGVVGNEPTLMATDGKGGRVLAIGRAATQLVDRGGKARTVRPVRDGNGVDYGVAGAPLHDPVRPPAGPPRDFPPGVLPPGGAPGPRAAGPGAPLRARRA